jgi:PEP-CTERM motif
MKTLFQFLFIALSALFPVSAWATTISSTVNEDNGATATPNHGANQAIYDFSGGLPANHPAIVAAGTGFDFSSTFSSLSAINSITFTMTMIDGDSASGNFDFNHLSLYLGGTYNANTGILANGINTGIVLNGFRGNGLLDTLTFTANVNSTTGAAILSALSSGGGKIQAYVVSDNSGDTALAANEVFIGNDAHNAVTTLTLSDVAAVPEPATMSLLGGGLLLLAPRLRRFRRTH